MSASLLLIDSNASHIQAVAMALPQWRVGAAGTLAEARKHSAAFPQVHVTSAEKKMGIDELRAAVLGDVEL